VLVTAAAVVVCVSYVVLVTLCCGVITDMYSGGGYLC